MSVSIRFALATIFVALAIGAIVQHGIGDAQPPANPVQAVPVGDGLRKLNMTADIGGMPVFGLPEMMFSPINHATDLQPVVLVREVYAELAAPELEPIPAMPTADCPVTLDARRSAGAMVVLAVSLPCAPDHDIVVQHASIRFSAKTDARGEVNVTVPAMVVDASFAILIDNIEYGQISLPVPAVRNYDRAVLHWRGKTRFQLHAFVGGADIGDVGHVWSASAHHAGESLAVFHGFVQGLGTASAAIPYLAEVYTYPIGHSGTRDDLFLQIGVSVEAGNCTRPVRAMLFQTIRGAMQAKRDIQLMLPDCEKTGTVAMFDGHFDNTAQAMR